MLGLIATAATSYVVGSCATVIGSGIYEGLRMALDYYVLDRENGADAYKEIKKAQAQEAKRKEVGDE